jgi:VIT1/CCC1 family predicted Fe2+/Mn2+ transporter
MTQATRQYSRRFTLAMVGYVITILVTQSLLNNMEANSVPSYLVSIIPVLPVGFGMFAFLTYLRSMDELQRQIQLDAVGFSVASTSLLSFTLGMLETAGLPSIGLVWVMPMLIAFWGIGLYFAGKRYE